MFLVQLIRPAFLEIKPEDISCDLCNITYCAADYKVLFFAKKLCFFYIPEEASASQDDDISVEITTCHACLMDYLSKMSGDNDVNLIILDEEEHVEVSFPSDDLEGPLKYFDFSFLHGDNREEDEEDEGEDDDPYDGYEGFLPPPDL